MVARFHQPFHRRLTGALPWMPTEVADTEVCELMHQDDGWHTARRLVLVTSLLHTVPPLAAWRDYNGRAGSENMIKELDAHFGLPQLCLKKFWASEAALSLGGVTTIRLSVPPAHRAWWRNLLPKLVRPFPNSNAVAPWPD